MEGSGEPHGRQWGAEVSSSKIQTKAQCWEAVGRGRGVGGEGASCWEGGEDRGGRERE